MTRLRILHLGKFYPPVRGGIETVLQTLCNGEREAVETRALVMNRSRRTVHEVVDGVPVTRVGSRLTLGAVAAAPTLPLWLARAEADLLVLHEPNPMALLAYFIARPGTPLVLWYHSDVVRPGWRYRFFYRPFLDFALRRAARIVVGSPPMLQAVPLAAHRARCVVIPFGLDVARYQPTAAVAETADILRSRARVPILLFVGRLVTYKGVDVLLRALSGLDAQTVIVGDGPRRVALETMVRDLGIGDRVQLVGSVTDDERLAWLHACAALVLPSITRQEAFGMVQLEAMACARPVVSTDLPTGVPWVNVHGETGLVVPAGDVGALRGALDRLVEDAGLRHTLGAGGRARVAEHFTAERMCAAMVALYSDVHRLAKQTPIGERENAERQAGPAGPASPARSKRAFDIALSGAGLVASAPLWLLFGAAVKLQDGGPIFYRQERSGLHGRRFHVMKFRTMVPDAEAAVGAVQAAADDPRVTPVGRWLRASAMDELPQLWNILRGDMSFVGPRALRPGEIETLGNGTLERLESVAGFAGRSSIRPGLTGIAQIYARRDLPRRSKFRYDLVYVRRRSFWLDVRLVLLSFWITARGKWEARGSKL